MNNNSQKQSSNDDIPIPSAPSGRSLRVDALRTLLPHFIKTKRVFKHVVAAILFVSLSVPSFLFSPSPVLAISQKPDSANESVITIPSAPRSWDTTLSAILENEVSRHKITNPNWVQDVETYIDMVKHIESDGNHRAYNQSGAMSYFQFKAASIQTAYTRLINYMVRHKLGRTPLWAKRLNNNPTTIYNVHESQQALFMVINIIEQDRERGTDYFARFLAGDQRAGVTAYYKYHHTNPDRATKKRTERLYKQYFPKK